MNCIQIVTAQVLSRKKTPKQCFFINFVATPTAEKNEAILIRKDGNPSTSSKMPQLLSIRTITTTRKRIYLLNISLQDHRGSTTNFQSCKPACRGTS